MLCDRDGILQPAEDDGHLLVHLVGGRVVHRVYLAIEKHKHHDKVAGGGGGQSLLGYGLIVSVLREVGDQIRLGLVLEVLV